LLCGYEAASASSAGYIGLRGREQRFNVMMVMIIQQIPTKPRVTPIPIPNFAPLPSPGEGVMETVDGEAEVPEAVFEVRTELVVGVLPSWVVDADAEPGAVEAAPS
jgi:hypothetical protein